MDQDIFREYDIRGIVGDQLDEDSVTIIARAITAYFRQHNANRIAVGYDARESSPAFHKILTSELNKAGCDVLDIGLVPTPILYFTLFTKNVDGGVMITASHNPANHNGFKISLGRNSLYGVEIQKLKDITIAGEFAEGSGKIEKCDVFDEYISALFSKISFGDRKIKAVVDAGNGMGGVTAIPLYKKLGVEVVELFCNPDSNFPNHEADPSQEKNLQNLIAKVLETESDLGIAFDGDGDRVTIIDDTGRIIWGDELMILFSCEVLREYQGATIVAEVKCTQMLFDEIERSGGKAVMSKAGHSIIKAKMRETGAVLGGEMSGHIFFADKFYGFDDAAYAGARLMEILSKTGKKLSGIFAGFPKTFSTPEIRVPCAEEKKFYVIEKLTEEFSQTNEVITIDGLRINFKNGWGLVRPSNTQALLILRFEADSENHLQSIREKIEERVNYFLG